MNHKLLITLLLIAIVTPQALALSASPASKLFLFNASEIIRYDVVLNNDESTPLEISIMPTGPLANQSLIDVPTSIVIPPGESRTIGVRLRLPATTLPGTSESGILFESRAVGLATVTASSAVMHVIRVRTPQEGMYLTGELLSSSGIVGCEVLITLHLLNVGSEPVTTAPSLLIDGARQQFESITIQPSQSHDLVASWTPRAVGVYTAVASVPYGSSENRISREIIVGTLNVKILGVTFGEFRLGDPFRVSADALNEWGDSLPVQATFALEQSGKIVSTASAQSKTLTALAEARYTGFLETSGAVAGPATVRVRLVYADTYTEVMRPVVLGVDSLEAVQSPLSVPQKSSNSTLWLVLFIICLLLLAAYFIYRKRVQKL